MSDVRPLLALAPTLSVLDADACRMQFSDAPSIPGAVIQNLCNF